MRRPRRISRTIDGPPRPSCRRHGPRSTTASSSRRKSIALDVKRWGLTYGLFEDNPDKVAAAARALRRRDKIRNTPPREQSSQGVYDILVQESRQLMSVGKLDEAEAKARKAQRMNVVPPLTADRAEAVLHEIAMARAQKAPAAIACTTGRRGSQCQDGARSQRAVGQGRSGCRRGQILRGRAAQLPASRLLAVSAEQSVPDRPASDPAVQQIAATGPGTAPDLAAPMDNPSRQQRRSSRGRQSGTAGCPAANLPTDPVQATSRLPLLG